MINIATPINMLRYGPKHLIVTYINQLKTPGSSYSLFNFNALQATRQNSVLPMKKKLNELIRNY